MAFRSPYRGARASVGASGSQSFHASPDTDLVITFDLSSAGQGDGGGWIAFLTVADQTTPGDAGNGLSFVAGDGANGFGATAGADGGNREDYSGNGGAGTASAPAGSPGYVFISTGFPGANNGGGGADANDIFIDTVKGTGAGRAGDILLGTYVEEDAQWGIRRLRALPVASGQFLLGALAPVGAEKGRFSGSVAPAANADVALFRFDGTIVEASSGTHALFAGVYIATPTITAGAAAVTAAASLYIQGAPAPSGGAGYSLWIDAGTPRVDSAAANSTTACVLTAASGPAGAQTAVQEWLVLNINGNTRYIPAW